MDRWSYIGEGIDQIYTNIIYQFTQRRSQGIMEVFQSNIFHSRSSQSPAPVTILPPALSPARYRTRLLWPIMESILSSAPLGPHFHRFIWLRLYPWVVTSQLLTGEYNRLQIWDPVSTSLIIFREFREKTLSLRSAVPAPEVIVGSFGLKPIAFTAAWCSSQLTSLPIFFNENNTSLLSFPPVAMISELGFSFNPQISWECALYLITYFSCRQSWMLTQPSLPPVQIRLCEHPRDPTLPQCRFSNCRDCFVLWRSNILTLPSVNPTLTLLLCFMNATEQRQSVGFSDSNIFRTLLVQPDQMQRELWIPTPMLSLSLQSTRFKQKSSRRHGASSILQGQFLMGALIFLSFSPGSILAPILTFQTLIMFSLPSFSQVKLNTFPKCIVLLRFSSRMASYCFLGHLVDEASSNREYRFLLTEWGINRSISFLFFLLDDSKGDENIFVPEYSIGLLLLQIQGDVNLTAQLIIIVSKNYTILPLSVSEYMVIMW